jgi:Tfp pilus assembly protein PilZ
MSQAEHRRAPRIAHPFMVRYQPPGKNAWLMSPLRDLSSGGARFFSEHVFTGGDVFEVQLVLPSSAQPVPLKARVAWVKPWRAGLLEIGITFDPGDVGVQRTIDEAVSRLIGRKPA